MPEDLRGLIEKIQIDGVKAAEDKAMAIEADARRRAGGIAADAEKEARRLILEAKERLVKMEEGAKNSIKQASRDTMLSLRAEIVTMLGRLVASHVHKALSAEDLAKILLAVIKAHGSEDMGRIAISLRREDLDRVEKALFSELGQEAKKGITLTTASGIHGGFQISYDGGKSYFDFSDKALAEYIAAYLKADLGDILKSSVSK